jgi:hypothetical protein
MNARLKFVCLVLSFVMYGFVGCAPRESFSWIDRHCFVADWTNHHSCVSCCRNGGCQQSYPMVEHEMLVLGNQPTTQTADEAPIK